MATKVIHRKDWPRGVRGQFVLIGRPSRWGNPFVIGSDGDRSEVIRKHREWFLKRLTEEPGLVETLRSLRDKKLVCYCAPKPCHGDLLAELADMDRHELDRLVRRETGKGLA